MSEILSFTFNLPVADVRSFADENGELWFVAKDICDAIGLDNVSQACKRLDDADVSQASDGTKVGITSGYSERPIHRDALLVSEPGLYELVIRSDKPNARPFIRWLTHDVIPSLRKTGTYTLPGRTLPSVTRSQTRWGWQPLRTVVKAAGYSARTFVASANALDLADVDTFSESNYASWSYGGCLPAESLVMRAEKLLSTPREQLFTADVLTAYLNRGPGSHWRRQTPGGRDGALGRLYPEV